MPTWRRRALPALVAAAALVSSAVFGADVADAAPAQVTEGPCPTAAGVTVVVDYQQLGGGVVTRCAGGTYDNGIQALAAAFGAQEVARTSGFVCRIANRPETDTCIDTPPHTAYWGYFRAPRGGTWKYSTLGAANPGTAKAGSVQGWSFSDGTNPEPRVAPPADAPAATAPPATAPPATAAPSATAPPGGGGASAGSASGGPVTAAPGPAARPSATVAAGAATTLPAAPAPGDTTAPGASTDATTVPVDGAAPAPDASVLGTSETVSTTTVAEQHTVELAAADRPGAGEGGSPVGALLVVGVVAALGGAAWGIRRRRA